MADMPTSPPLSEAEITRLKGKSILWVEDDTFLGGIIAQGCSEAGMDSQLASDGEQALHYLETHPCHLIVLDIMLPKMDGFELLQRIKLDDRLKNIPVIMLSNLGEAEQVEKAKKFGAVMFLVKAELTLDEIMRKLSSVFA
jgi:DNA-binding response OmpR family regulator